MEEAKNIVLNVFGMSKSYEKQLALKDISLELKPGEFVGLLGPNGAGKSTLIDIASGILKEDAGDVKLFGSTFSNGSELIRQKLGVVFQARSIDLEMTIEENLNFHGQLYGISYFDRLSRIRTLAKRLDFTKLLGKIVRKLSGGQQRKVEIARALLHDPSFLILDEATTGLDTVSRKNLISDIIEFTKAEHKTVLWSTHYADDLNNADRVLILSKGCLIANETPKSLLQDTKKTTLNEAYNKLVYS